MLVVGLDASSQFENFGYALGSVEGKTISIARAGILGRDADKTLSEIGSLIGKAPLVVIAIDAPLGWPEPLGRLLSAHHAGEPLDVCKNRLFRRRTDRVVRAATGKNPLEVGADRIARAAHHAVQVLGRLRELSRKEIPLAWTSSPAQAVAIEVYPAATLISHDCETSGYKHKIDGARVRGLIAEALSAEVPDLARYAAKSDHEFDACLCLLAAKDFLSGEAVQPDDITLAKREGWIWARSRLPTEEIWARLARDIEGDTLQ